MNDLRTLFGPDTDSERNARPAGEPSTDTASLRALVGAPTPASQQHRSEGSSGLKALVGDSQAPHDDSTASELAALVGGTRANARPSLKTDLSSLVGSGGVAAEGAGWQAPELAQVGKRPMFGGRRKAGAVNYLSVAAAVIAVVALVGTASFAVVQRATANPADDAMVSLREREAELANETKTLQTAADLFDASVSEAANLGQSSATVFVALQGRVDAAPLATAEASRLNLLQVAAAAKPVSIPTYQRGSIDEKDLVDVGEAIDGVRLARESLPPLVTDVRDARSTVTAALTSFRGELSNLGSAIESEAAKAVTINDSASQSFRAAVTDAAARVKAAQQAGGDGLAEMPVYAAALDALRTENARILALEQAERNAAPTTPRNPGSGSNTGGGTNSGGGSNTGGGNQGGSPDTGTNPDPAPSQPAPDPEPVPDPTESEEPPIIIDPEPAPSGTVPGATS